MVHFPVYWNLTPKELFAQFSGLQWRLQFSGLAE
jgi:hypothetical protein